MSVFAPTLTILWRTIESYGIDPAPLFEAENIRVTLPIDPGTRVPFEKVDRIRTRAVELSGDEAFGIRSASSYLASQLGALGYAWQVSLTLRKACLRLERFIRVVNDKAVVRVEDSDGNMPLHLALQTPSAEHKVLQVITATLKNTGAPALKMLNSQGRSPLALAFQHRHSAAVVKLLLQEAPDTLTQVCGGACNLLPLHLACQQSTEGCKGLWSDSIIMALESPFGAKAAQQQVGKKLPLHIACANPLCSLEVVHRLVQAHPMAIRTKDDAERLPLACIAASKSPAAFEIFQSLCDAFPDALDMRDLRGRLPLHIACSNSSGAASRISLYLINQHSQRLLVRDRTSAKSLPLHLACRHSCSVELIKRMVQLDEKAVVTKDDAGLLPLHYALMNATDAAAQIVLCLVVSAPDTLQEPFGERSDSCTSVYYRGTPSYVYRQRLPLHMACECLDAPEVIIKMAELHSNALTREGPSHLGASTPALPLHIAARSAKSVDVVQGLAQLYPWALTVPSADGKLPLHYACMSCSQGAADIVQYLLQAAPEAVCAADKRSQYPLTLAATHSFSATVLRAIILATPSGTLLDDHHSPIEILLHRSCVDSRETELPSMLQALLDAPAISPALIYCPSPEGKGCTLAAHYARGMRHDDNYIYEEYYGPNPHIMQFLLRAAPNAIWTIECAPDGLELCHAAVTSMVAEARAACEAAWSLNWAPGRLHQWMPHQFKQAVMLLLMAKKREQESHLSYLPHEVCYPATCFILHKPVYLR